MRLSILAFACGVLILQLQPALPGWPLIALMAGAGLLGMALARRSPGARGAFLAGGGGALLFGIAFAAACAQHRMADALPLDWEGRDIVLTGVVAALPQRFERGERFEFSVESVQTPGAQVPAKILLSWYRAWDEVDESDPESGLESGPESGAAEPVRPGERWRLTVRLKRPHGNANPFAFDYEAWLLERGLRASGTIRARADNVRLDAFVLAPGLLVERWREHLRRLFLRALPDAPFLGVLIALTLGDQRSIPAAQWTLFNRTGVTHLVSISGLHVTMVAALFAALIGRLWRQSESAMLWWPAQKAALVAGWLAALSYALIAGFEVPAQRTLYMLSVVALSLLSGRNAGASRTLSLALLAVLLLDPWAVLATGFWLSFGAVAVLFYAATASPLSATGGWAALRRWGLAQWAVTLFSAPLLLFFFQQFSLVSPLANALAIPWVSFVITPLALSFALLPWPPLLALDHWLLAQLMLCLEWLAQWPLWQRSAPPLWSLLPALLGVFWLLLPRGVPARWIGVFLLLPMLLAEDERPPTGTAWVDVLDVGQGLAVVVRTSAHALLYDTGPLYSAGADAGQRVVLPYLRAVGVDRLDGLVISHRDRDHAGGAGSIRAALPVTRLLSSIAGVGEACVAGTSWVWDGVRFDFLHPLGEAAVSSANTNRRSCVLRVEAAGRAVLLPADIEARDEQALIQRGAGALRSEVLVVPHHGGRGSSSPAFIAAVGAHESVFSVGYRNPFGHPRPEVLARYGQSRQWRTDRDGALHIVLGETLSVSAWRAQRRRYWQTAPAF